MDQSVVDYAGADKFGMDAQAALPSQRSGCKMTPSKLYLERLEKVKKTIALENDRPTTCTWAVHPGSSYGSNHG